MIFRQLLAAVILVPLWAQAAPAPDPVDAVRDATDQLLAKLVEVKPLFTEDPDKFFSEVETSLSPFIDFDGFARGVMAKYYRRATEAQQSAFAVKFQAELVRTYANALVEFDNQKVEIKPLATPPSDGRATVELDIYGKDGAVYPVVYTLALVDGRWKLRNVVVEGINLGLQFRSQFANYMQKYGNDIDKVIENWDVDVSA